MSVSLWLHQRRLTAKYDIKGLSMVFHLLFVYSTIRQLSHSCVFQHLFTDFNIKLHMVFNFNVIASPKQKYKINNQQLIFGFGVVALIFEIRIHNVLL